jgi:hypothetical protein
MKIVCGHAHPQNNLPYIMVKSAMKTIKKIMPNASMKKSCGQNIFPEEHKLRINDIDEEQRISSYINKRQDKENSQADPGYSIAILVEFSFGLKSINPVPFTGGGDAADPSTETFIMI